ncbi:MAG: biotin carboxylase, partial [Bacteroidota bacterium]
NNFLPSVGELEVYQIPVGENIRVDDGYTEGMQIPIYYDPMIAKLITYGATREAAIQKMIEAIADYQIEGVATTLPFGRFVMQHEAFVSGHFDTHFVKNYYTPEALQADNQREAALAAKLALQLYLKNKDRITVAQHQGSDWRNRLS